MFFENNCACFCIFVILITNTSIMKRVLLIVFAATILFACNTERKKQSANAADQVPVEQESPELIEGTIDDDDIPESMWTRNFYNGTLSGGGKTYNITMAISFPGTGAFPCSIVGSYQYKGHDDSISLEGDWIELTDLYEQYPVLSSDEYLERFELEMNGEDLISSTVLKGTWKKYDNKRDYDFSDTPKKKLDVVLRLEK